MKKENKLLLIGKAHLVEQIKIFVLLMSVIGLIFTLSPIFGDLSSYFKYGSIIRGGTERVCKSGEYAAPGGWDCDVYEFSYSEPSLLSLEEVIGEYVIKFFRILPGMFVIGVVLGLITHQQTFKSRDI